MEPSAYLEAALAASAKAYESVAPDAEQVPTPLPQGAMPAWLAAGACALDAGVHAWDIATATGQPSPLTREMAAQLRVVAGEIVDPLRAYGAYAALWTRDADLLCFTDDARRSRSRRRATARPTRHRSPSPG